MLLFIAPFYAKDDDDDDFNFREKIIIQRNQEKCLLPTRTKDGHHVKIEYHIFTKQGELIGEGNVTLAIGVESELNNGAEFLSHGRVLIDMCVGNSQRLQVPVSIIWEYGYNLITDDTQNEIDYLTENDTLTYEVKLHEIIKEEMIVNEDDFWDYERFIEALWRKHGGRKFNIIKGEKCSGRKTKDGDTIKIDYDLKILKTNDSIESNQGFMLNIGNGGLFSLHITQFFSRGGVLLNMCVGEERDVHVPLDIASRFGYDSSVLDVAVSNTLIFRVLLREILVDVDEEELMLHHNDEL